MTDIGYENHNALQNLGSLGIMVIILIILVVINLAIGFVSRKCKNKRLAAVHDSLSERLYYGEIIGLGLEGYIEFMLTSYYSHVAFLYSTPGELISLLLSYLIMFSVCVFIPCACIWMLQQPSHLYHFPAFKNRWGVFYDGMKIQKDKFAMMFNLVYMWRRAYFLGLAFYVTEHPVF